MISVDTIHLLEIASGANHSTLTTCLISYVQESIYLVEAC